ncbi:MAG: PilZ domain-containing protein [Candidatus Omnitrophica bacterium]|nr:PilZ domain-containing protein [Candidatus Omnitrophota bacterium]MDE2222920.1 PilZ domain-containing protein [Candidatus Omnitrophota bacterium]
MRNNEQRSQPRVNLEIPATISIGSQLSVKGQLKDLALNSAFIKIKNILYLNVNDEIGITIEGYAEDPNAKIAATARISRIVPGEGFAVYFTQVDEESLKCIKKLLQKSNPAAP